MSTNSLDGVFEGKDPTLRTTFDYLLQQLEQFGAVKVAPKQTSIHLEKNSGFAGVHPRKSYFNIEFRIDYKIDAPRITRVQQLSARRFEHTVKVESRSDIDEELLMWLKSAYELSK
jgi:hypothetical protein